MANNETFSWYVAWMENIIHWWNNLYDLDYNYLTIF